MRSLVILLCLGAILGGCSFAKDPKGSGAVSNVQTSTVDAITAFDKLLVGIRTNDSKLFEDGLKHASVDDLNRLSFSEQTLIELCIEHGRLEFFEKLVAAGTSIFRPSIYSSEGLRKLVIKDQKFRLAFLAAKNREMSLAFAECVKDSPIAFSEYLQKRWISPLYSVCGPEMNFFDYHFSPSMSRHSDRVMAILDTYLNNSNFSKAEIVSAAMAAALRLKNESVFDVLDAHCLIYECFGNYHSLLRFIEYGGIKEVLDGYEFLVKRYDGRPSEKGIPKYIIRKTYYASPVPPSVRGRFNPAEDEEIVPGTSVIISNSQQSDRPVLTNAMPFDEAVNMAMLERRAKIVDPTELSYFDERAVKMGLDISSEVSTLPPFSDPAVPENK